MRHHYDTETNFKVGIIALGSERPVKEFIKLTFNRMGDIYLFDELLPDKDRTELHHHLSLHESGAIYNRSPGKPREHSHKRTRSTPLSGRPAFQELSRATTALSEDFFYEGHRTIGFEMSNHIVAWCPYRMVIGSTLRWSIDLVNREEDSVIDHVIRKRFPSESQASHVFSFSHQGRTVVACMEFSGGTAVVDERKLKEVDAKKLQHHRVWVHDRVQVE